ncbi:hypothetical protein OAE05_00150 [Gammaproteobacteria bacterium]|nr:hypothetical protein [Gammaproteobacteria bacterium]|tara:strand:+ start:507 stop:728 length:222 start_codon:yes stop_codon:yes gene_type:complete
MDNVWRIVGDVVSNLTTLVIALIGLGIVGTLAFGDMGMTGLDPIAHITSLVSDLASMGVVGLLVLAVLMSLVK